MKNRNDGKAAGEILTQGDVRYYAVREELKKHIHDGWVCCDPSLHEWGCRIYADKIEMGVEAWQNFWGYLLSRN